MFERERERKEKERERERAKEREKGESENGEEINGGGERGGEHRVVKRGIVKRAVVAGPGVGSAIVAGRDLIARRPFLDGRAGNVGLHDTNGHLGRKVVKFDTGLASFFPP